MPMLIYTISLKKRGNSMGSSAAIFCNGEYGSLENLKKFVNLNEVFVIGVDGGCNFLIQNKVKIDFLIGDFDSIEDKNYINEIIGIEKFDMDYSDFELAINYCIENNFEKVYLLGCTGKRSDHFIFNLRLMEKIFKYGIDVIMIDDYNLIMPFKGNKVLNREEFRFFSIVPLQENTTISIEGSKYDVKNQKLDMFRALTLSNEWKEEKVKIFSDNIVFLHLVF